MLDPKEKRRLKKLGKALVEQRAAELRDQLSQSNQAAFASDQFVHNEIEIRKKQRAIRSQDGTLTSQKVRRNFVIRPIDFDLKEVYPASDERYWECRSCGDFVLTSPPKIARCSCCNLIVERVAELPFKAVDGRLRVHCDYRFLVRDESLIRLVQLLGKVEKGKWWKFWK